MYSTFSFVLVLYFFSTSSSLEYTSQCQRKKLSVENDKIVIDIEEKLTLRVYDNSGQILLDGNLGVELPEGLSEPTYCQDDKSCLEWGTLARISLRQDGEYCTDVIWETSVLKSLKDCFNIRDHLYI